jgi:hypothetical protein
MSSVAAAAVLPADGEGRTGASNLLMRRISEAATIVARAILEKVTRKDMTMKNISQAERVERDVYSRKRAKRYG